MADIAATVVMAISADLIKLRAEFPCDDEFAAAVAAYRTGLENWPLVKRFAGAAFRKATH
jgi:hypothetical protein